MGQGQFLIEKNIVSKKQTCITFRRADLRLERRLLKVLYHARDMNFVARGLGHRRGVCRGEQIDFRERRDI